MKKTCIILGLLIGSMLLLTACPVGMDFPLGYPGNEIIDNNLIGTWKNDKPDADVQEVTIRLKDKHSYDVEVLKTGSFYQLSTRNLTGYVTQLAGRTFVYFIPCDESVYYLYCYKFENEKLISNDVGLKVGGKEACTSTEAFRKEVEASLKLHDCLTDTIVWTKEQVNSNE